MASPNSIDQVRRLARGCRGASGWADALSVRVDAASDTDLGTMVVARAVLAKVVHDRYVEVTRQQEADARRVRQRLADEQRTREAMPGELASRRLARIARRHDPLWIGVLAVVTYCLIAALVMTMPDPDLGRWAAQSVGLVALCGALLAACLVFDWFAFSTGEHLPNRSPDGPWRGVCPIVGLVIGVGPWVRFVGDALTRHEWPQSYHWMVVLPVSVVLGWLVGGALGLLSGAPGIGDSDTLWFCMFPGAVAGALGALGAVVMNAVPALTEAMLLDQYAVLVPWDWSGGYLPTLLIGLGVLAVLLHVASWHLTGWSKPLGIVAMVLGPVLGTFTVFINPANPATWLMFRVLFNN
jgi:hypothetical protein